MGAQVTRDFSLLFAFRGERFEVDGPTDSRVFLTPPQVPPPPPADATPEQVKLCWHCSQFVRITFVQTITYPLKPM